MASNPRYVDHESVDKWYILEYSQAVKSSFLPVGSVVCEVADVLNEVHELAAARSLKQYHDKTSQAEKQNTIKMYMVKLYMLSAVLTTEYLTVLSKSTYMLSAVIKNIVMVLG